jgi:ATP-dependent helicase/nuclease subunit A
MNSNLVERVLAAFTLTPKQELAALARGRDIAVTAGAGSGKTRTLVARYACLLAEGIAIRKVVAITFSDKAAQEMRSRARETLDKLVAQAATEDERGFWLDLNNQMDAARISTIHSLCAEILRAHPVEARIDPRFEVLDEGLTAALRAQIVNDVMARLVSLTEFAALFRVMGTKNLTSLLALLLEKRLEAQEIINREDLDGSLVIQKAIASALADPSIADCIAELRGLGLAAIYRDGGDKLGQQAEELLSVWSEIEAALVNRDSFSCAGLLFQARRNRMGLTFGSKSSRVYNIIKDLQVAYDRLVDPICGGKDSKGKPPNLDTEADFALASGLIEPAFELMIKSYREALVQRGALDFDDLENGAVQLLSLPEIQERWQGEIEALLVDEFQDTNERQRKIVRALAGAPGKLFVVGDAKQSIYRFRRADVTVFRSLREEIRSQGGLHVDLDETFRTHRPLLEVMSYLLEAKMGTVEDPSRPFFEPFSPMVAIHELPREGIIPPHIEFVYGAGENAAKARPVAAQALAARLLELKQQGQIKDWDDVVLLFRASTGFPFYENAFEDANIPFVTVAGRGFYDRPEIRDVLNILQALANPIDDLAMAGLLRSPAFGLTDIALYQLRRKNDPPTHFFDALHGDLTFLNNDDCLRAERALSILIGIIPCVDRVPVAELIKQLIDTTDYRAVLATGETSGNSGRMWRNIDKLVVDAENSGKVNVRDFFDYITTINDVGAREGEAPADAQGSVRLMTIHKSKGLEFPIVVLADAGRRPNTKSEAAYLLHDLGLAFKLDPPPMLYLLAKQRDQDQDNAEEDRVLYVALTRAQEKLIISGHATPTKKSGWTADSWLSKLGDAAQVDINQLLEKPGTEILCQTMVGQAIRTWAITEEMLIPMGGKVIESKLISESGDQPLYAPLVEPAASLVAEDEAPEEKDWHSTRMVAAIPPGVIGHMVHKALELWIFPGDPKLQQLLDASALEAGLAHPDQRSEAINYAMVLLGRLHDSPIWKEIDEALENYHELPYTRMVGDHAETGYIDLLYRSAIGWEIVDFKTDAIQSNARRTELINAYTRQLQRYASVVSTLFGEKARRRICFLDSLGTVDLVEV